MSLLGVCAAVLLAELLLRARSPRGYEFFFTNMPSLYDTSIFEADAELIQVLKPGARAVMRTPEFWSEVRVNALGLRGPELTARARDEVRILTVGDSFTLGAQVAEEGTFQALLGAALTRRTEGPVTVLNAGVDGYGTDAAVGYARRLVPQVDAKIVLLTFFLGNDFWDNDVFERERRRGPPLAPRITRADKVFGRWSFIYFYGRAYSRARWVAASGGQGDRHREELQIYLSDASLERSLPATRAALQGFANFCEELGVQGVVALAPPAYAVESARAGATFALYGLDATEADLDRPARVLAATLPDGLLLVDPGPALRAEAAARKLYFTFDGHWAPDGHAIVADFEAEALIPLVGAARAGGQP